MSIRIGAVTARPDGELAHPLGEPSLARTIEHPPLAAGVDEVSREGPGEVVPQESGRGPSLATAHGGREARDVSSLSRARLPRTLHHDMDASPRHPAVHLWRTHGDAPSYPSRSASRSQT